MASRFNHGESSYHDFFIAQEGENKGKILEKTTSGEIVRPLDLSFSKDVLAVFIGLGLMLWIFISIANSYKKNAGKAPSGLQSVLEPIILFVRDDIAKASIGKNYERYMPFLLTIFFFIWINNLMGIIPIFPGGANVTGNITVTMVLALFTFAITTFVGNRHYWKDMVNAEGVPWWLKLPIPLMPIIEIMGMFIKPFVLMIRLFANMAAGHIIALGFISLIFIFGAVHPAVGYGMSLLSISFTVFMTLLELLVALIQAYVFTLLSALYFGLATQEHH
jgi:F-type H+-transporting ATPase subunit a